MPVAKFSTEIKQHHTLLSNTAAAFLDFVEDHPESLSQAPFQAIERENAAYHYPIQPWPTFISRSLAREMDRKTVGMSKLLKSLFDRIFANDPEKLAAFFQMGKNLVKMGITGPNGVSSAITRIDGILTSGGMKIVELNCGSGLGGWDTFVIGEKIPHIPMIAEFLGKQGISASYRHTARILFAYMIEEVIKQPFFKGKELNIAVSIPASTRLYERFGDDFQKVYQEALALKDPALTGHCSFCETSKLEARGRDLYVEGRHVFALLEQQDHLRPTPAFRCLKQGGLVLMTGPMTLLLSDKRNLALMSDPEYSVYYTEEELSLIRDALPWTRLVVRKKTNYRGQEIYLPDFLVSQREKLVLKLGQSWGGQGVLVGRETSESTWNDKVKQALDKGGWIVQEFIPPEPFYYPVGEAGCEPHHLVWGLFAFGDHFGGGWVRTLPVNVADVVNATRGANNSVFLEVDE